MTLRPKLTAVAPVNPLPVIVITLPPEVLPEVADRPVIAGADGALHVNRSADPVDDVPLGVVTVMSYVPAACAGATAVIWMSEVTVK